MVRRRPLSRYKSRMATERPKAIDCWLNLPVGFTNYRPEFLVRVARDYFKREKEIFEPAPLPELLAQMDTAGVERAVITIDGNDPEPFDEIVRSFPGKFLPSAVVDPLQGMETLRLIDRLASKHGLGLVRIVPFLVNRPPNDKAYYPVYAKCIELGLPISINTGIPGPPMPAEPQRPLYLDEVCLFFPELTLIMAHGADPWWGEAIRLLLKYPNLYMMTSRMPKYLPGAHPFHEHAGRRRSLRLRSPVLPLSAASARPRRCRFATASSSSTCARTLRVFQWPDLAG